MKLELAMWQQIEQHRPVRIIVLKARQEGVSTDSLGIIFHRINLRPDRTAYIVAHILESADHLYDILRTFKNNLPPELQWATEYENKRLLKFVSGSAVKVQTANNFDLGKSDTVHYVLESERAYCDPQFEPSLLSAVPDIEDTIVIKESTGNLYMDDFHKDWERAKSGESEYIPVFVSWFEHEEYRRPVPSDFRLSSDEERMRLLYGLDLQQVAWYRYCLENKCKGDINEMRKYYPSDDTEPFLSSGLMTFGSSADYLKELYKWSQAVGYRQGVLEVVGGIVQFREQRNGWLKIWDMPEDIGKRKCMLGADIAEGKAKDVEGRDPDWSAGVLGSCYKSDQWEQHAEIHERVDPDLFAYHCLLLACMYGRCMIFPEANASGREFMKALIRMKYSNIYSAKPQRVSGEAYGVEDYGWLQTEKSRKELVSIGKEILRNKQVKIKSEACIKELMNFVTNKTGKDEATTGAHDDLTIGALLMMMGMYLNPHMPQREGTRMETRYAPAMGAKT